MKSIIRALITAAFLLTTSVTSFADTASPQAVLTSFDFNIVGVSLKASPDYQAVPKGIASKVNASFEAVGFNLENLIAQLPKDYTVRAELTGPAFQTPFPLVTPPGTGFDLPTLAVTGRYTLSNIRLVDGNGNTLFGAVPQLVAIESINDPLVTSVTTRQLTQQELQDRGVTFDKSNFAAYEFTAGIATSSGQIPLTLPVIIPTSQSLQQTPILEPPSPIALPQSSSVIIPPDVPLTAIPQNLDIKPFMMAIDVEDQEKVGKIQLPAIPGVVVIPGNIGFLHQYFSALALVSNGAPLQSGLSIRDVQTAISFPVGEDLIPGTDAVPGDDPLRMAKGQNGYFPRTMPVMNAGLDGKAGTADDISRMLPGESGQSDFTIEGLKEGTHKVDFEITATLEGLPIGPVTLKGKASGAVLVRNPDFSVTMGHPATVRAGEEYDLFITVSNTGKSLANQVSVGLDPRALSGASFVAGESNTKSIDTIQPGSAASVKFRLKSQRTGKVTATAFESPDMRGRFILRAGVGENNIPLSPDSLILAYTGSLPADLITSAVGLLGQAWSVATAPTGALPASVLPITKQTVTSRAYDLSEAGLRVLIGDDQVKAAFDLTFDFFGSDVFNKGFDSLRRSSTMGLELNRALGNIYKTGIDATGVIAFQAGLADKVSYRPGHLSIVSSDAPLRLRLTDAGGNRSGALTANENNRAIPYADSIVMGENGSSRTNLILNTRLDSPTYTLELVAESSGSFDLGVVMPDAAGVLTQYIFSGISLPAGATGKMTIQPGSASFQLELDDNGDGVADRIIAPSSVTQLPDHAPHIVAATQLTPNFGPGGDKHGRNVAVLFSERVTKESAQNPANYGVNENLVKQVTLQPGSRMAFLLLRDGIGPFFERSLTVQGVIDQTGRVSQAETLPIRITASGPAAVVTGTVRTARGEPVPNATIRLYQLILFDDGYTIEPRYALFTEKQSNADGSYRLEYVLQNDDPAGPFQVEVINPITNEAGSLTTGVMFHGQRLQLDIFMKAKGSLSGVVRNEAGNPVGGVTVQVLTLVDNRGQSVVTDASGAFSFSGLMIGAYSLRAVSQATLSQGSTMGTLAEDGTAMTQDVTIRRVADVLVGTVVGKVLGADGVTPRGGVIVIVNSPNYQSWQRTAADGSFSFSGVYAGAINVTARDDSSGEQSVSGGLISTSGQIITLNVIMKGTGSVTGLVKRDDGKSAEGLYVVARPSQGQPRVLLTDGNGGFRVDNLPIGNVNIDIIDPRDFNRTVASGTVTILSAGDTADITLFVALKAMAVGTIQGTVYHRDGSPWANAPIKRMVNFYQYYNHQSDSTGKFTIPNLSFGSYTLTVVVGSEVINASSDIWYDTQLRTLELRPVGVGTVTGTTWDDAAKTMPTGADVTLYSTKPNQVGVLTYDTDNPTVVKSDPQTGRFSFTGVMQGNFTVSSSNIFRPTPVSGSGAISYQAQVVNVDLPLKGSPPVPGEPVVNQPGSVSGLVLMPDGTAAGKDVRVTLAFGGADVTVTTDDTGHFHFAPLIPSGNHAIIAEDPATTLKWKGSVNVPSGLDVPITIKLLGRGTVTVKVLSANGSIVPAADIDLKGTSYPNDLASGLSDSSGQALFTNLSEGSYAVSASGTGSLSGLSGRNQVLVSGDKTSITVEVRLAPSAAVTGRFLKADGVTPILGGQITLTRSGQVIAYASSSSDSADPGRFRIEYVPLGDFIVEGYDPVTERRGIGAGRLNTDGEVVAADVVVTPRGSVKGTVLNYGGTAPIAGAPVSISVSGVVGFNFSSVSAPDGSFFYSGVPAGRYTVHATDTSNGQSGQVTGTLSYENETVTTQVRIAPTGSIAGRVLMPDGVTPVTTATVRLNGGSPQQVNSVTAAFLYENLATGRSYSLSSSQPNTRRTGSSSATITRDLEVANGDIMLGGVGSISGVVFDSEGTTPLSGAKVELHFSGGILIDYTAGDGTFSFGDIPTGYFSVVASHTLRTTGASMNGYLQNEGQVATVNLVLGPVGSVKVTVLMADGVTPSRGGGISISTNTGRSLTGISDSNGQYTFSNIPTPCTITLYTEDAAGLGIGRATGVLDQNGQLLDLGTIVLDDKPIFVTAINPASGTVNVPIDQTMRIVFSEPADPSTLNSTNIYLAQGANRISGTLQIDADNSGVTFTPAAPLKGFTLYTLVVSSEVKDRVWRKLALPQSVSFTTVDNVPPVISSVSPAGGTFQVASDAVVRLTFSEVVDPNSLAGITLSSGGVSVATRSDLIQNGTVVVLTPLEPLAYNRTYTVNASGVKDMVGNVMSSILQATFSTIDTIAPTISQLGVPSSSDLIKGNSILVIPQLVDADTAFVDFYVDDVRKATVTSAPFTMVLTLDKVGTIHLKAIAQDKMGNRGLPAFLDLDINPDTPPEVSITSPADGSTVNAGATLTVNVQATDDLFAKEITLTVNGELVATQTKSNTLGKSFSTSFTFTVPTSITQGGTISLTATAKDSAGNLSTLAMKTITVLDAIAPTVTGLTSPGQTTLYKPGETGSATVTATDNVGVASIVCNTVGATGGNQTFTFTPPLATASRTFTFVTPADAPSTATIQLACNAIDAAGNSTSKSVTLQVADVVAPQVAITSPAEGSTVNTGATLNVNVQGADDMAMKEITLTATGEVVATQTKTNSSGKNFTTSFSLAVPTTITQGGSIQLTATAKDMTGNVSQTVLRTVTVLDGILPTITALTSTGQTILYKPGETGSATVVASDNMGVASISCTATGASTTSRTFTISPAQTQLTQELVFQVAANAGPGAAISIACTAVDAAGNPGSKSLTLTVADIVPPQVSWTLPANNAVNVPINSSATVTFDDPLAAATVNSASVGLTLIAGGQAVPGLVTLSSDRKSITFKPTSSLVVGTAYTLAVGTMVTDDAGNALAAPYRLSFTTDSAPPAVASVSPTSGSLNVPVGSAINVTFAEQIDPASVTVDKVSLTSISGLVPGTVTVSGDGLSLAFKPYNQLGYSRLYTFTLKAGVRDISGNAITGDLTATFTTQVPDSDMVGYWPMDGDWTDYSGNGNHGTANGGAAFSTDKVVGTQSGSFDGVNEYVEVQNAQNLSVSDNLSIEAWIKPSSDLNGYATHVINKWGAGDTNQANYVLYYFGTTSGINRDIGFYANAGGTWKAISARYTMALNTWYHVALTYNSATGGTLYINGVAQGAPIGSGTLKTNSYPLRFGATTPNYFKGLVDEVSIYKRYLPLEDINEHYNAGLTSDRTSPVAPTVEPVTSPTYSNQIILRGTKEAGSSIRVNGKQIVAHDSNATWLVLYTLALGQNLLDVTSHDVSGNVSPAVNLVINVLPPNPNDPIKPVPQLTLTSPGQTVKYKPGELGSATVTATNPNGIAKLYCNVSGAANEGNLVVPFDPPQSDITRQFTFLMSSDAVPYAPYRLSCIAETVAGTLGISNLDLQTADIVAPIEVGSSIQENATDVQTTSSITVAFNEALSAATVSAGVTLNNGTVNVGGNITLSTDLKSITFTPLNALDGGVVYTLAVSRSVTDIAGNGLTNDFLLHFKTLPADALQIINQGTSAAPFTLASGTYTYVFVKNSYVVAGGPIIADSISLLSGSVLAQKGTGLTGSENLDITATSITIDATSKIDVSGKGYLGGGQSGNGVIGRTFGNVTTGGSTNANSASYGGPAGVSSSGTANSVYGVLSNPNEPGSGGSADSGAHGTGLGGNGGGLVRLQAGTLTLNGSIVADGVAGTTYSYSNWFDGNYNYYGASGSGGGVWLNVGALNGTGSITARGGTSTASTSIAGGGGGRIAIFYNSNTLPPANIIASGGKSMDGSNAARNGGAGTIYLKANANTKADVIINNGGITTTNATPVPGGAYASLTANGGSAISMNSSVTTDTEMVLNGVTLSVTGGFTVPGNLTLINSTLTVSAGVSMPGNLSLTNSTLTVSAGLSFSGNLGLTSSTLTVGGALTPPANPTITGSTLTVGAPLVLPSDLTLTNSTMNVSGSLTIPGALQLNKGTLTIKDNLNVTGNITLTDHSVLSHYGATTAGQWKLDITAPSITIDTTSKIDVTGRGYLGGRQSGNVDIGRTLGNVTTGGSAIYNSGSYGGLGGVSGYGGIVNGIYGVLSNPNEVGSGGGATTCSSTAAPGGNGGGQVRLQAGTLTLNGSVIADGMPGATGSYYDYNHYVYCYGGSGSGGGIWLNVGALDGTGSVTARGGASTNSASIAGGGGGRIAIYYDTNTLPSANIIASGGKSMDGSTAARNGGAGTIYLKKNVNTKADVIINNGGTTTTNATPVPGGAYASLTVNGGSAISMNSSVTTDTDMVLDGVTLSVTGGFTVPGNLTLINSTLTVSAGLSLPGSLSLTNSALTVGGALTPPTSLTLTNSTLTVGAALALPTDLILTNSTMNVSGSLAITGALQLSKGILTIKDNLNVSGNITLTDHSVLSHYGATTAGQWKLDITAPSITIDTTSKIDVTGRGYLGGRQSGNVDIGRTLGNVTTGGSAIYNSGSYGGLGGVSGYGGTVNGIYGVLSSPNEVGSGGGTTTCSPAAAPGGNGGGLVRLQTGTLTLNGSIIADGTPGATGSYYDYNHYVYCYGGGGSGGGIWLNVGALNGTGSITARGGASTNSSSIAGGGGGRIAIYYDTNTFPSANIIASGGKSMDGSTAARNGGAGTIYLKANANTKADVIINNGGVTTTNATPVPGGTYASLTVNGGSAISMSSSVTTDTEMVLNGVTLTVTGGFTVPGNLTLINSTLTVSSGVSMPGNLSLTNSTLTVSAGLSFSGNLSLTGSTLTVGGALTPPPANPTITGSTLTVGAPLVLPSDLTLTNSTMNVSGSLTIPGSLQLTKGTLNIKDNLTVSGNITLTDHSVLSHYGATTAGQWKLDITAPAVNIDTTSKIDVTGRGYLGGRQSGNVDIGRTLGNVTTGGSAIYNSGSYGGLGGVSGYGGTVNGIYGVLSNPNEVGSGGGTTTCSPAAAPGGNGGGLVRLQTGTLTLNGSIVADGTPGATGSYYDYNHYVYCYGGGGSGGGIWLNVGALNGTGSITANGSASTNYASIAGGGGGRIAIYYDTNTLPTANIIASGGKSMDGSTAARNGGAGTIYLKRNVDTKADVIINNGGITTTNATPVPGGDYASLTVTGGSAISMSGTVTTDTEMVLNGVTLSVTGGFTVPGNLTLINSTLTVSAGVSMPGNLSLTNSTLTVSAGLSFSGNLSLTSSTLTVGGALTPPANPTITGSTLTVGAPLVLPSDLTLTNSTMNVSGSLTIPGSLQLTKGTLNIKDNLNVTGNITLTDHSVLSHYGATTAGQWKLDITAPSVTIDTTSKIDVTGRGYLGGRQSGNVDIGRTLGNVTTGGSAIYNSGSYGGLGGVSGYGGTVNGIYGVLSSPNEVGSGGGTTTCSPAAAPGGNGGGLVRLQTGTLTLNGSIIADGTPGATGSYYDYNHYVYCYGGGGSGGGIWLNVGALNGTGSITANGSASTNYASIAGGGGGRIAIYYDTNTLPTANIIASGGKSMDGSTAARNGGAGTVYLKANANTKADLIINNGGITTTRSTPIPGGDYRIYDVIGGAVVTPGGPITSENEIVIKDTQVTISGDYAVPRNLTLLNGTVSVSGIVTVPGNLLMTNSTLSVRNNLNVTGTVIAQTGSILTHEAATASTQYKLEIQAAGVTIDSTSRIDVKGKGYLGGLQGDNGIDVGRTAGNITDDGSAAGNGGSLGGVGGISAGATATSYGSIINPAELGSGGGGDIVASASGGNGGGFVKLTAPTLTLNGIITADGMDSLSGAGSGGSIRLDVTTISGNGSMQARGGNGGSAGAGGGRIALYYTSSSILAANIYANGGRGGDGSVISRNGGAGTLYLKQNTRTYADLLIDNRSLDSAADSTPLKAAGKGSITVITGSSLIQSNTIWGVSLLNGYWINPNISQTSFFKILDNSVDTVFINPADGNLNSVAVVGNSFSGVYALNSLTVLGKAHLYTDEQFNVIGDAAIDNATVVAGELYAGRTLLTNGGLFERR